MTHRLNTNKQFMIGNGMLAFAVIFVVVLFVYMSMRLDRNRKETQHFAETYEITLTKGFEKDSLSIFINDSLCANCRIDTLPVTFRIGRFAEENALMIVDNRSEAVSIFSLSSQGGSYRFEKGEDGIRQLPQDK